MKWIVSVILACAAVNAARAEDPRGVSPADLAALVAVATGGEPVRITSGASGFNLYGKGKSGQVGAASDGVSVSYGGKHFRAARVAGGWIISGNGLQTRISSRAGGAAISGDQRGSVSTAQGNSTRVNVDGKILVTSPSAGGAVNLR